MPARWNTQEIGFFDPQYDGKTVYSETAPIEHTGKNTYFRDVHLFLNHAKQFVSIKKAEVVCENLWLSLRGTALSWWTNELFDTEHRIANYGTDMNKWIKLLVKRFKQPSFVTMESLLKESYTLRDVSVKCEPHDFT